MSLPTWEKLQPLRRCYVRLLDPDGDVFDVWQNHLEATLEGLNEHHRIFRSEKEWQSFLQGQRNIATDWDLRHTLTAADRRLLAELKIVWEQQEHTRKKIYPPIPAGRALVRTSDGALHHLPAENIEKARAIDPELQVLHIEP